MQRFPQPFLPFCLVIDPSSVVRLVLFTELKRARYPRCVTFADPREALKAIIQHRIPVPDVALICWRLPWLDGVEVVRFLRAYGYHTTCILLLDQDQDSVMWHAKARLAGAQNTLLKPFTMQQLHAHLAPLNNRASL